MENKKPKAVAIDGNCLMYRCFFATLNQLEYYKKNNLKPVNALNLFIMSVLKILKRNDYQYGIIAFDAGKTTFRTEQYSDYKKNRKPMPDALYDQLSDIQDVVEPLGFFKLIKVNYEADDLIGSFNKLMNQNNIEVDIYTSDRDMLQLVDEDTTVQMLKSGTSVIQEYNINNFSSLFDGLWPYQIPEYKGLAGDSSDHIKGIPGVGHQTAVKLLTYYKTIDNLFAKINETDLISVKLKEKIIDHKDQAFKCKALATIYQDLLTNKSIANFKLNSLNNSYLEELTNKYHLHSLKRFIANWKEM
ncbi:MAG: 5'-3' exonuclease [Mycoplasma sp.]